MTSDIEQYRWAIAELRRRGLPENVIAAVREDVAEHIRGKLRAAIKRRYHLSQRQKGACEARVQQGLSALSAPA